MSSLLPTPPLRRPTSSSARSIKSPDRF
jgi:hypothetical protein